MGTDKTVAEELRIEYPITVEIKVHFTKDDRIGTTTVGGPTGRVPTHDEILQVIANAKSVAEPDGFKIPANPQELMELRAYEVLGQRVCCPTPEKEFCYSDEDLPLPEKRKSSDDGDSWEEEDDEWDED